jgi:hypothetical protein
MNPQTISMDSIRRLANGELSLAARLGYVALLLAAAAMSTVVLSLWLTEPALPVRTQAAFGVMSVMGIAWVVFALWALSARRPLFARDRLIAGRMAVTFTAVFVAGALAAVIVSGSAAAWSALASGGALLALAVGVWRGARLRVAALTARRATLETGSDPIC